MIRAVIGTVSVLAGFAVLEQSVDASTGLAGSCKATQAYALLQANEIGMELTESLAMMPAASVSGFYLSHPQSTYFNVGKIGEDQLQDQARRRGADVALLQRLLAPNL